MTTSSRRAVTEVRIGVLMNDEVFEALRRDLVTLLESESYASQPWMLTVLRDSSEIDAQYGDLFEQARIEG